ncbi:hypothetical protein ACOSQ4_004267 [Xanthoceras sorbifolium]
MAEQSVAEVHLIVLLDALTQTTSDELFVKDRSLFEILPHNGTKAPAQRRKGDLAHLGGISRCPPFDRLLCSSIKGNLFPFSMIICR